MPPRTSPRAPARWIKGKIGLFPALQASGVDLQLALKQTAGGTGSGGQHHRKVRGALVVSEMALALMLLVGAGLLIRTSLALRAVKPGFDTHDVLTMRLSVSGTGLPVQYDENRLLPIRVRSGKLAKLSR